MTARFRSPAGRHYNARASELAQDRQQSEVVCSVLLLDNAVQAFKVNKHDQGQVLLDLVFKHLELTERDYFGLQLAGDSSDSQRWLDPTKPIRKQLKRGPQHSLNFRVKFFVTDPNKLQEEYTRYQYFLQIKQDVVSGRLPCPYDTAAVLASYAVQSELGDYSQSESSPGYLSEYCFIPNAPQDFEKEVAKRHQHHTGLSPAQSEFNYLSTARALEFYGVELHNAKDQSSTEILLGVMSAGIVIYKSRVRINSLPWVKIVKISFKCRRFFIQLRKELPERGEALLGFSMSSYRACKNVWKACVEHHTFFRLERPLPPHKNFLAHYFTLGSKYRYRGRTEAQSVQYGKERGVKDRVFTRSPSKPLVLTVTSGTDWESVSRTSLSDERLETQSLPTRSPPGSPRQRDSMFEGSRVRPSSVGHLLDHVVDAPRRQFSNHKSSSSTQANSISLDSTLSPEPTLDGQPPALPPKQSRKSAASGQTGGQPFLSQLEMDNLVNELYDAPGAADKTTLSNGEVPHDNLVLIKMSPDEHGRFGFNVKGGADQKMPIIVSRVSPGTPADLCVPRLNEGDQVVLINGLPISELSHDEVVLVIKASCEERAGELTLLVRPNAIYEVLDENLDAEPQFQYLPERAPRAPGRLDADAWRDSLQQLKAELSSGAALAQFDQLYRKRPGMTMTSAKLSQNISKNRYRDISPYDATRVILKGDSDYINANYINMEIPGCGRTNRYIACQGPLPGTCADFWQMTWEQQSSVVVMLTTQVERGRVKCHQYWPAPDTSSAYGAFRVDCLSEEGSAAFLVREMTLTHLESEESRPLTQIQYLAWPDHGVPDDSTDFLELVSLVRRRREGSEEPVLVHCSAGIGRTGVLITMETAMCLMEGSQPVYPLDMVRAMRDQRAMMIQTPSQYRFVCEAILKVYGEELVKPLTPTASPSASPVTSPTPPLSE